MTGGIGDYAHHSRVFLKHVLLSAKHVVVIDFDIALVLVLGNLRQHLQHLSLGDNDAPLLQLAWLVST